MEYLEYLKKLLDVVVQEEASDLDISVGHAPNIRITGQLIPLSKEKIILPKDSEGLAFSIMSEVQRKKFLAEKEIDFSYQHEDKGRFRVNIFFQRGSVSLALRFIPSKIRTIEELSLPPVLHDFIDLSAGACFGDRRNQPGKVHYFSRNDRRNKPHQSSPHNYS